MKNVAEQKLNELKAKVKQKVSEKMTHTEQQWRQIWQEKWGHRLDNLSENISNKMEVGRVRGLSVLNGIVGDYLAEKGVPLAVQMAFYDQHQPLELDRDKLSTSFASGTNKLCIMVHGLGCTEDIWRIDGDVNDTYAERLANELGYTSLYVRYNTGLHISHNGQMLSQMIEQLLAHYPHHVDELIFITHSMGGLVTRSACFYGSESSASSSPPWTDKVRQLYFLGSPHLGADLEKIGSVVTHALKASPLPYTQFLGELFDLRSDGIKDLRFGYVRDEDWQGHDDDTVLSNNKNTVPLLAGADHYVISGTVTKDSEHILSQLFGDALVRKYSATGQSSNDKHSLDFLAQNQAEFNQVRHVALAHNERVYQQILIWANRV